ncbi:MAG: DegT/DnrJ/EryC1/StrS family aminotransferase [Nanoarchaeota archaeon]
MIPVAKPYIDEREIEAVSSVLRSGILAQGSQVLQFEKMISSLCRGAQAIAVSNGTAALDLALKIAGISEGDEVITTPFTFVSTANAILMQGAIPVFVDIDSETFSIDPEKIKNAITKKTKAILPVDLYGQTYQFEPVRELAAENDLTIVEDACQAIGATHNGKPAGTLGELGTFSMYATKNITSAEGGMIVTSNNEFARIARLLRNQGQYERYKYSVLGYNFRLTEVQAAIGVVQMSKLDEIVTKRQKIARLYDTAFKQISWLRTPILGKNNNHVYHQYTLVIRNRDDFAKHLANKGIGYGIYYPKALYDYPHLKPFTSFCPVAERIAQEVISLPIYPSLSESDQQEVIDAVTSFS